MKLYFRIADILPDLNYMDATRMVAFHMFGGTGGYFLLDSLILANIVQLGTQIFCGRFLNRNNDPCGR